MSDPITNSLKSNIWVKIGLTIVISFLLMIPVSHIKDVIKERHEFGQLSKQAVAEKWSNSQAAGAIVFSVPVEQVVRSSGDKGKDLITTYKTDMHFLPSTLKIKADTESVIRYRGLYKVPLYETRLTLSGDFKDINPSTLDMKDATVVWEKARISMGIKEVRGLKDIVMKWNDKVLRQDVGEMPSDLMKSAINGHINSDKTLMKKGEGKFFIEVTLRGSEALDFYPFGQTTTVDIASNWGSPSFSGAFLPESHEIEDKKFQAKWKILGLTRNLPKHWSGDKSFAISDSQFGVNLHMPLQSYQLNTRAVKYSILFILLTFVTMFFIEVIYKIRFHPLHYAMTGAGLILFYLLLLSFSEHIGFGWAYAVAGTATVVTISMYVLGVTRVKKSAAIVFTQLGLLYGFLFVLLQQEDFTLVFGASGLWVILAVLMYATRKVNWFDLKLSEPQKGVQ